MNLIESIMLLGAMSITFLGTFFLMSLLAGVFYALKDSSKPCK